MRASWPTAAARPDAHRPACEGDTVNGVGQKTAGDLMFEQYLREHGYAAVEHEPDLGVAKRPDYVIERAGKRCVVVDLGGSTDGRGRHVRRARDAR
jgi:hypothetical protein